MTKPMSGERNNINPKEVNIKPIKLIIIGTNRFKTTDRGSMRLSSETPFVPNNRVIMWN